MAPPERPNREYVEGVSSYIDRVRLRHNMLKVIADALDEAGITVSDVQLGEALTSGKITLYLHDVVEMLGREVPE